MDVGAGWEGIGVRDGAENMLQGGERIGACQEGGKQVACPRTQAVLTQLALSTPVWMQGEMRLEMESKAESEYQTDVPVFIYFYI